MVRREKERREGQGTGRDGETRDPQDLLE